MFFLFWKKIKRARDHLSVSNHFVNVTKQYGRPSKILIIASIQDICLDALNQFFDSVGGMCLELSVETVERLAWVSAGLVVFLGNEAKGLNAVVMMMTFF